MVARYAAMQILRLATRLWSLGYSDSFSLHPPSRAPVRCAHADHAAPPILSRPAARSPPAFPANRTSQPVFSRTLFARDPRVQARHHHLVGLAVRPHDAKIGNKQHRPFRAETQFPPFPPGPAMAKRGKKIQCFTKLRDPCRMMMIDLARNSWQSPLRPRSPEAGPSASRNRQSPCVFKLPNRSTCAPPRKPTVIRPP